MKNFSPVCRIGGLSTVLGVDKVRRDMTRTRKLFANGLNPDRRLILGGGAFLAAGVGRSDKGFAMQKFESGRAMSDGLGVYYEVHGGPLAGRTPMVLVAGGLMPIEIAFAPDLLPRFARHRPVIAIEPQGHGHTGDRATAPSMEQMAEDVRAVLDHLKVGKAHLLGHSLGGMILTGLAIRHPGRVASLVPVSAPYAFDGMLPELVLLQRDPTRVPSPQLAPLLPTQADFASWKAVYERVNPDPGSFDRVVGKLNGMLAAWPGWRPEEVAAIKAPTLVALGDNDFMRVDFAAEMARLIPHAQLAVLPDTTHMDICRKRGAWLEPMVEANIARAA
jgi:pimeloyl-ACP methyl ester carboxylesterase